MSPFRAATNGPWWTPTGHMLKEFDTDWKNAEAQPALLQSLIEEEMSQAGPAPDGQRA